MRLIENSKGSKVYSFLFKKLVMGNLILYHLQDFEDIRKGSV